MDKFTGGKTNGRRMDGWMDGWMSELMITSYPCLFYDIQENFGLLVGELGNIEWGVYFRSMLFRMSQPEQSQDKLI